MERIKQMSIRSAVKIPLISILLFFMLIHAVFASEGASYKLLPGDTLQISVWKEPDLQAEVFVRPDGKISFPLAGHLMAAGLSPEELEVAIAKKLGNYLPSPVVTAVLTSLAGYKIYVLGKVAKPGEYIAPRINVMQALSLAGGLTPFASEKIRILRAGNEQQAIVFYYDDVADGDDLEQNIVLLPGDVIVVQ